MIQINKYRFSIVKILSQYMNGIRGKYVFLLLLSSVSVILIFIEPTFYRIFINDVIMDAQRNKLKVVVIGYAATFLLNTGIGYAKYHISYTIKYRLRYVVKHKVLRNSLFYNNMYDDVGDIKIRIEDDSAEIEKFVDVQSIEYLLDIVKIITCLILLIIIEWRLIVFTLISIPLTIWLDYITSQKERQLNSQNIVNEKNMYNWLTESVSGWREVRNLNLYKSQERTYVKYLRNYAKYFGIWINYWTVRVLIIPKIKDELFMQFALYFLGGFFVLNGTLNIGDLFLFASYYKILSESLNHVSSADAELRSNQVHTDRILTALKEFSAENTDSDMKFNSIKNIRLEGVSYRYPDTEQYILSNINLNIHQGEKIAIVGRSGCGKTTVLKLICGLLNPTEGAVFFGNTNISKIGMTDRFEKIGYVMQENTLFHTTIRENLQYAKMDATEEEMIAALKKAEIYDYIAGLPEGLDTEITEKGGSLSGGQRQKIVLARLYLRNVDVYIFDEATSAVDGISENLINEAILEIPKDKIVIIVSHKPGLINLCDRVINLSEEGD